MVAEAIQPATHVWRSACGRASLYLGDCRDVLAALPEASVETCLTDPPYGLSFMGRGWDRHVPGSEFWTAVRRVCKPGAMVLAFGGTRTFHRLACAIEDAGLELRDTLCWLYGSGFPKSADVSKQIDAAAGAEREIVGPNPFATPSDGSSCATLSGPKIHAPITAPATADLAREFDGWGTALKPAWEPVILAMVPLDGTFSANAERHGVAGLWIDGARIGTGEAVGRFPANLALDEDAAAMLDEQSGNLHKRGNVTPETQRAGKHGMATNIMDGCRNDRIIDNGGRYDSGGASRFFYCAKASTSERSAGLPPGARNLHPTVKPLALMRWLARLTRTPRGGTVLDPFMGSGTTGVAAIREGRRFVGVELDPAHFETAKTRIEAACLETETLTPETRAERATSAKHNKQFRLI